MDNLNHDKDNLYIGTYRVDLKPFLYNCKNA